MNRVIHIAVFIGVLLQAAIPLGFMPGANAATPVVICSGMDRKIVYVDDEGQPADQQEEVQTHCVFSATTFGLAPVATPAIVPASYWITVRAPNVAETFFSPTYLRPWQTGPPHS